MSAYVISEVTILDENLANTYRSLAAASIVKYEGRYLVRGANPQVVEGKATERRIVIVEFPSLEKAQEWYTSPDYAEALQLRESVLDRRLMFVEGL
ncbi:MAG TPA: DUF1330 domain-containing protein [Coleofasciculaceae cyanobacterium]